MVVRKRILKYLRENPKSTAVEIAEGEPEKRDYGITVQDFMEYPIKLKREYDELKAENNRLRGELNECRRKLARLAQRIVRQNIYGNN